MSRRSSFFSLLTVVALFGACGAEPVAQEATTPTASAIVVSVPPASAPAPAPSADITSAATPVASASAAAPASEPRAPSSTPVAVPADTFVAGPETVMAVAVGGMCEWIIDGHAFGTSSRVEVKTAVGVHVVACKTPAGATRSQRVTAQQGKKGIASFKLD